MNKEDRKAEAEHMFIYKNYTFVKIADLLDLSDRTLRNWSRKHNWQEKRQKYLESRMDMHEKLYEFIQELLQGIREDMLNGKKIDSNRAFLFGKILPIVVKPQDYEEAQKARNKEEKAVTKEDINKIIASGLGLNDD